MMVQRYINGKPTGKTALESKTVDLSKSEVVSRINGYTTAKQEKSSRNVQK